MYFPDCGYLNRPGVKFCSACQTPLGVAAAAWRGPLQADKLMDNGRYRIIRPLGKGGMGAVYLAENLQAFGREVVIKEMLDYFDPAQPDQVERARRRFEDEARTLAALKHPSVPDIYGYFSQGGRNYLVMEFIVGENLETGVTHRDGDDNLVPALPYTAQQIVLFGIQLCDLLEYLAGRKDPDTGDPQPIIHHDIKPANAIRDPETDRVWLVDFGTAKTRFGTPEPGQPSADKESIYGTVGYAPPEQYRGESEPRSDVYALAATLYHLLTDDDPRDHPFQFDRLDQLETNLRLALTNALAQDTTLRSTAADFKVALNKCMPDQPAVEAQPLTFPNGESAHKLSDIPHLAQEHWDYTRDILQSGDLEHWLRRSLHNPVVAETAKRSITTNPDQDAALDTFLRELDPELPGGKLQLGQKSVEMGTVTTSRTGRTTVELNNNGKGYSHGAVTSSAGWLREKDKRFGVKPGGTDQLEIEADTDQLTPGQRYQETLTLTPADGSKPLKLKVSLTVAEARVTFSPAELVFNIAQGDTDPVELTLTNSGGNQVECTLTRDEQWLLVRPKTLTLPGGQSAKTTVAIRPDRLPPLAKPRTQLTLTPTHGPPAAIPVTVLTRPQRSPLRFLLPLLLGLGLIAVIVWGAMQLLQNDSVGGLFQSATPTPPARTAADLNADLVPVTGFSMDRYEVSNLQYTQFDPQHSYAEEDMLLPAVDVTWDEAKLFCESVNKRLPTMDEWLLAAGGEETWDYPWGNQFDHTRLNSADNRDTDNLMAIGSFPAGATPSGIHDLLGNASEWVIGSDQRPQIQLGGSWQHFGLVNSRTFVETLQSAPNSIGFRCVQVAGNQ